ncbi:MAG: ABC transporter ATP-binding protein [Burkholderiales bacterium]
MSAPLLDVRGLRKRFGGVVATDDVTLEVREGEVHALIGPNGAGKTSLIAQLSGSLLPDSGEIRFAGADVTRMPQHARVKLGLVRSFQITRLFRGFTALENLSIGVQARDGRNLSFWRPVAGERALVDEARALLDEIGLGARGDVSAAVLSHGEQRALEVGLALATRPKLLLLDEPMAGTGPEESARMVELIERVRTKATVLLVEHDVDAVFRLADRVSVLVNGRVIASGEPEAVRHDPEVISAYLGDEAME